MPYAPPKIPLSASLTTPRLQLRAAEASDAAFIWSAVQHPDLLKGLGWKARESLASVQKDIEEERRAWEQGSRFVWTFLTSEVRVGGATLSWLTTEPEPASWLLAYWVPPEFEGKGYATEAAKVVLEFAFSQLNATHIWAGSATWNEGSRCVLEKLGMTFVEQNPRGYALGGEAVVTDEFLLTKNEWEKPGVR